jgi:hypothetical protein
VITSSCGNGSKEAMRKGPTVLPTASVLPSGLQAMFMLPASVGMTCVLVPVEPLRSSSARREQTHFHHSITLSNSSPNHTPAIAGSYHLTKTNLNANPISLLSCRHLRPWQARRRALGPSTTGRPSQCAPSDQTHDA